MPSSIFIISLLSHMQALGWNPDRLFILLLAETSKCGKNQSGTLLHATNRETVHRINIDEVNHMELKRLRPGFILVWGGVMAAGAVLLLTGITNESLWYDEAYTGSLVRQSFSSIIHITGGDNHPPLYYLALRAFTLVFGNTVFTLRLFSVIGALAMAALGIGPVRRALGDRAGFIYTVFTPAMPITISMAQEARMYTWAAFLVTGSALYGYFGWLEGKTKDWILFGVFTVAAAYTHYYALLAVALLGVILQAGQWSFIPSGLPVSILTGKLAADRVLKELRR